jgi:hypothetical protein
MFVTVGRLWRRVRPGRNPLARVADRLEAKLLITMIAGMALAVPLAVSVGRSSYARELAASAHQAASVRLVPATLLGNAPAPVTLSEGQGTIIGTAAVPARWTGPTGTVHEGKIRVPSGSTTGTTVGIWISGTGVPVSAPGSAAAAAMKSVLVGLAVWASAAALLVCVHRGGRGFLDRHRLAGWGREWAALNGERAR